MKAKVLVLGFVCFVLIFCGVSKEPVAPISNAAEFHDAVIKIFEGYQSGDESGVATVSYDKESSVINYDFFPLGMFKYEDELGVELATKIKRLYEIGGEFNSITFLIHGPFQDAYGKNQWKPILSFEFSKQIYNKINWDNFVSQDLLKVAQNVEWFRRGSVKPQRLY